MKSFFVYILSGRNKALYIGMTSNLEKRIWEHKEKVIDGHTKKYNIDRLVYFEETNDVMAAIAREKQLKKWNRQWKIELVEAMNPNWCDLSLDFLSHSGEIPAFAGMTKKSAGMTGKNAGMTGGEGYENSRECGNDKGECGGGDKFGVMKKAFQKAKNSFLIKL